MKLPAYPKYKSSGVEWLEDVPEHWEVKRLRYVSRFAYGESLAADDREDGDVSVYGSNGSVGSHTACNTREPVIIVGRKGSHGKVNYSERAVFAIDTTYFIDQRYSANELRWLFYVLGSVGLGAVSKDSAVPGLAREDAYRHFAVTPPVPEQCAIANFLDAETAKLDTLVAKKRELIEKLKENRSALISRAVTRGLPPEAARSARLNPNPKLKPSGIEWLGEIPAHWEVVPLGYLVRFRGGATPDKGKAEYWEGSIPWVSPKDMKQPHITEVEDHISEEALRNSPLSMIPVDAVLIVVRGMILVHSFPVALVQVPLTINQDMKALICGNRLQSRFSSWALNGYAKIFVSLADESAHGTRKIETPILSRFPFSLPSPDEQRAIADYLDRDINKIDRMVAKVEEAIERLQEYRTALITAAVTGKIDVRNVRHSGESRTSGLANDTGHRPSPV